MELCEASNSCGLCPAQESGNNQIALIDCRLEPQIRPILLRTNRESTACMKVFTTVMLRAWRQRRRDVKQLQQSVDRLEKKFMQSKNQLHVYTTLMRVEQKRNSELQLQLRESKLSIIEVRSSCENLTTSVLSLTAEKTQLQQELHFLKNEYEELQKVVTKTNSSLFDSLLEQHHLQNQLSKEERIVQNLQHENKLLLDEALKLRNIDNEYSQLEDKYIFETHEKDEILCNMQQVINNLEDRLQEWSNYNNELQQLRDNERHLNGKIAELRQQIEALQTSSNSSFVSVGTGFQSGGDNQYQLQPARVVLGKFCRYTTNVWYLFWIYLLPGVLPPLAS